MFSHPSEERPSTAAATIVARQKRQARSSAIPSIIGADIVIKGTITATGDIQIDGRVDGDVCGASLVIGESGQIYGKIVADDVMIRGHIKGRIRTRKVLLCSVCYVEGDILHEAFAVEAGAIFKGNCIHSNNPLADNPKHAGEINPVAVRSTPQPTTPIARPNTEKVLSALYPPSSDAGDSYSALRSHTFTKYLFLLLLSAGMVFAIPNDRLRVSTGEKPAEVSLTRIIWGDVSPSTAPSDFEKKMQMNSRQLIGRGHPRIMATSRQVDVSAAWIDALMRMEGGGRTMLAEIQSILPNIGATGVMQVMPASRDEMLKQHGLGVYPYDPHDNVSAGTAYQRGLYQKYGPPKIFTTNNGGPGKLDDHIQKSRPIPVETRTSVSGTASILGAGAQHSTRSPTRLAKFTRPDGSSVWIDVAMVSSIRAALPGEYAPGVQSVVSWGKLKQGVRESAADAAALIRNHGDTV